MSHLIFESSKLNLKQYFSFVFKKNSSYNLCSYLTIILLIRKTSHIGKEQEDAERDAMLIAAGYTVIRYTQIPTIRQLQRDLK